MENLKQKVVDKINDSLGCYNVDSDELKELLEESDEGELKEIIETITTLNTLLFKV